MLPLSRSLGLLLVAMAALGAGRAGAARPTRALAEADSLAARVASRELNSKPMAPELVESARRVLQIRERELGPDAPATTDACERLAGVHLRRAEPAAAESLMRRVVTARRNARPSDAQRLAFSLAWLAEAQRARRQLPLAVRTADSALAALGEASADTAVEIRIRTTLGDALAELGSFERGRREFERAVALAESAIRGDTARLVTALRGQGRLLTAAGDPRAALGAYERAAQLAERHWGPDSPDLATTLYMGTYALADVGDYVTERRWAERVVAIRERVYGPDHPVLAYALWTLAHTLGSLGEAEAAHAYYERAVRILRAAPNVSPADLATGLNNLGNSFIRRGDGPSALAALREARAVRERAFGIGRGMGPWSAARTAEAMILAGEAPGARAMLDSVLSGAGRLTPLDRLDLRRARASANIDLARWPEARAELDATLALEDSLFGTTSPVALSARAARAGVNYRLGRRDDALADALHAESGARESIRDVARGLSESEGLGFERTRESGLDVLLALATDSLGLAPEARRRALDAVVQSRLVVLDALADERRARVRGDAAVDSLAAELDRARGAYAEAMVVALRQGRPPDSTALVAREARDRAERALAERSAPYRDATRQAHAGLAEIARALPARAALVSFVRYGDLSRPAPIGAEGELRGRTGARYAAFVLRAGTPAPVVVPLGTAADLEARVERWAAACASPPPAGAAAARAAERRCRALGAAAHAAIWAPLRPHLAGCERVDVVPDGALHAVNFLALPAPSGGYLAESEPLVHRLTAERDLVKRPGTTTARGLLAMGGVDFDRADDGTPTDSLPLLAADVRRTAASDSTRVRFGELPETGREVEEVSRLWREARRNGGDGDAVVRSGAAASEHAFKTLAPGRRVLHLATHGFALGAPAGVAYAGTRAVGAVSAAPDSVARNRAPVLLPGLALAGANHPAADGAEDGFLTAEEITALDLSSVEWAVLSACETGRADPEAAEAVQGLHRAFRRAGARHVIMSLWLVDDEATRAWMRALYTARLQHGHGTAEAAREACRELIRTRRAAGLDTHPFSWAAFVATGEEP